MPYEPTQHVCDNTQSLDAIASDTTKKGLLAVGRPLIDRNLSTRRSA
jgi:hypothetical protein